MALTAGNTITSADIIALKNRVKAETNRRVHVNGFAAGYRGDFSQSAAAGQLARISHYNETVGYINLIQATGVSSDLIRALQNASNVLANCAAVSATQASESCVTATCRGLCYTGCATGCTGCQGCSGCGGACSNGCAGGNAACADTSCQGTCWYYCSTWTR